MHVIHKLRKPEADRGQLTGSRHHRPPAGQVSGAPRSAAAGACRGAASSSFSSSSSSASPRAAAGPAGGPRGSREAAAPRAWPPDPPPLWEEVRDREGQRVRYWRTTCPMLLDTTNVNQNLKTWRCDAGPR